MSTTAALVPGINTAFLDVVAQSNVQDIHVGDLEWVLNTNMPTDLQKYIKAILKEAKDNDRNYLSTV